MSIHSVIYTLQDTLGTVNVRLSDDGGGETAVWLYPGGPGQDNTQARFEQVRDTLTEAQDNGYLDGRYGQPLTSNWEGTYGWVGNIEDDRHEIVVVVLPLGHTRDEDGIWDVISGDNEDDD